MAFTRYVKSVYYPLKSWFYPHSVGSKQLHYLSEVLPCKFAHTRRNLCIVTFVYFSGIGDIKTFCAMEVHY